MENALLYFTIAYAVVSMIVGMLAIKGIRNSRDFFVGTYGISGFGAVVTNEISYVTEWLFIGYPAMVYSYGAHKAWIAVGLFLGGVFNWMIIGRKLQDVYVKGAEERRIITLPQIIVDRLENKDGALRTFISAVIIVFATLYGAVILAIAARFMSQNTKLEYHVALLVLSLIVLVITVFGGFASVHRNTTLNALFVGIAIVLMTIWVMLVVGHPSNLVESLMDSHIKVRVSDYLNILRNGDRFVSISDVLTQLSVGLGISGIPHMYTRLISIKSEKEYVVGRTLAIGVSATMLVMVALIAIVGRAYLSPYVLGLDTESPDNVFVLLVSRIVDEAFGFSIIAGMLMFGVLAVGITSVTNVFLTAAASFCYDMVPAANIGKNNDEKDSKSLLISRIVCVTILCIGLRLAWSEDLDYVEYAKFMWAVMGATLGPTTIAAILWKRTTKISVYFGMVMGFISTLLWRGPRVIEIEGRHECLEQYTGVYSLLVGFVIGAFTILLVSLLTSRKTKLTE